MVAQTCQPEHVEITDGNQNSIDNLQIVVKENEKLGLIKNVSYRVSTSIWIPRYLLFIQGTVNLYVTILFHFGSKFNFS